MTPEVTMRRAIDMHGHIGNWREADGSTDTAKARALAGSADLVQQRAALASVRTTVVSALAALREPDPVRGNDVARVAAEEHDGMCFYAVLNPMRQASFDDVEQLLNHARCVGIKIHPLRHQYHIAEYGRAVFEFSAAHQVVVSAHTGNVTGLPQDFIPFMNALPKATLILAHLGHDEQGGTFVLQTEAIKRAEAGNVYTDTSSANSICSGLIEYAVAEIGADKIVFGTDTPLYFTPAQKARIEYAEIDEAAKRAILWENATRLIGDRLQGT